MSTAVLPASTDEAVSVVRSVVPNYWRDASDMAIRGRVAFSVCAEAGNMEVNVDGSFASIWNVITSLPDVIPHGDSATITFEDNEYMEQLSVDIRGYLATDKMGHKNWLMSRGAANRIVDVYNQKSERLLMAMRKMMNADLYIDGNATANLNRYLGMNSFMGINTGNTTAADRIAYPSDTYGGQSTALGALGGSWSSDLAVAQRNNAALANDWPDNQGSEEYDALTFLPVNYTSTAWQGGNEWKYNCEEVLRWAIDVQANRGATLGSTNYPPLLLCGRRMWTELKQYFSARNQVIQPVKEAIDLGFPEVIYFEGVWICHDYDCPSGEAYLMHPEGFHYFTPQDDLFEVYGPQWHMPTMSILYLVSNYGNYRWQPKLFAKFADFTNMS